MIRGVALAGALLLAGCAGGRGYMPPDPPPAPPSLAGDQYLYGSAEGAANSVQAWNALVDYAAGAAKARRGVVLAEGATLAEPRFVPCGSKPMAAIFDVDETVLLNLGFEYDQLAGSRAGFDEERWTRWERTGAHAVLPVPGAKAGLDRLRATGVTVIFNTNRNAFDAADTERALNDAGLGPAVHGRTLYLSGDDATGSRKDGRRGAIAARWCVIALGGDQLGDFSDQFNDAASVPARRALALLPGVARLWGRGWFVLPNPVYGTALQGGADDIFPADRRWTDPGAGGGR